MFFAQNGTKNRLRYQATQNVFEALHYGANNTNSTNNIYILYLYNVERRINKTKEKLDTFQKILN